MTANKKWHSEKCIPLSLLKGLAVACGFLLLSITQINF